MLSIGQLNRPFFKAATSELFNVHCATRSVVSNSLESHVGPVHVSGCVMPEDQFDLGALARITKQHVRRVATRYLNDGLVEFKEVSRKIVSGDKRDGATTEWKFSSPDRKDKDHAYGGCMLAAITSMNGIHFVSRTTYGGYVGIIDAAIMHCIALQIYGGAGPVTWTVFDHQIHRYKSLLYALINCDWLQRRRTEISKIPEESINEFVRSKGWPPTMQMLAIQDAKIIREFDSFGIDGAIERRKFGPEKAARRKISAVDREFDSVTSSDVLEIVLEFIGE